MVAVADDVAKKCGRRIQVVQNDVNVTIVEQIAEGRAPRAVDCTEAAACGGRHFLKFGAIQVVEELRALGPGDAPVALVGYGIDVTIGDE